MSNTVLGGRYTLLRHLGRGGMADVFLACQTGMEGFERLVVIKRILGELAGRSGFTEMFLHEARTAADLRHPNVVAIQEIGEDDGTYYIVLEYLHGPDLRQITEALANAGKKMPLGAAVEIVLQAANGLHYVHEKTDLHGRPLRIVHRDITPHNLLVTYEGAVKVLDFGIAKTYALTHPSPDKTAPGVVKGKPAYMSPEQARGMEVDYRSDLFSLGIILYELTTGRRLFRHETVPDTLLAIQQLVIPPPCEVDPEYPEALEAIVMKALAGDPDDRYACGRDLAVALDELATDAQIPHSPLRLSGYVRSLFADDEPVTRAAEDDNTIASADSLEMFRGTHSDENALPPRVDFDVLARQPNAPQAPTGSAASGRPKHLRPHPSSFVGRHADLRMLADWMDEREEHLVTVTGAAGTGKTRLAHEFGLRAQAAGREVWMVDLSEARDLAGIVAQVARVLDVPLPARADWDAVIQQLGHVLRNREQALLILDNLEHLVEHGPATIGVWAGLAPELSILATSRELLGLPGEVRYVLEPLDVAQGTALFEKRTQQVLSDFRLSPTNEAVVAEIVRQLDGLPLAIELAAARMALFSPATLLERLPRRLDLLKSQQRSISDRQSTLRAAIDWSWGLLSAAEQSALGQCAVFRGGFTLVAAEVVVRVEGKRDVFDVLQSLANKSLIHLSQASGDDQRRFRLFESIRRYAEEKAVGTWKKTVDRHARYYIDLGERLAEAAHTKEASTCLRRLSVERENLEAVFERTRKDDRRALRAVLALHPLFMARGPLRAHVSRLDACLEAQFPSRPGKRKPSPDRTIVWALTARGRAHRALGQTAKARSDFETALRLARQISARDQEGQVLGFLGTMYELAGDHQEARVCYETALKIHQEFGNVRYEGIVRGSMGVQAHQLGDLSEAKKDYERAIELLEQAGDESSQGVYVADLGGVYHMEGRPDIAHTHYQRALALHEAAGNKRFAALAHGYSGTLLLEVGDPLNAEREYLEALRGLREVGDRRFEGMFLGYLGLLKQEQGELVTAAGIYQDALAILDEVKDRRLQGLFTGCLATTRAGLGSLELAEQEMETAQKLLDSVSDPVLGEVLNVQRGHLDLARYRRDGAEELLGRAQERVTRVEADPHTRTSDDARFAVRLLRKALSAVAMLVVAVGLVTGCAPSEDPFTPEHAATAGSDLAIMTEMSSWLFAYRPALPPIWVPRIETSATCPTLSPATPADPDGDGIPTQVTATYDADACRQVNAAGNTVTVEGTITVADNSANAELSFDGTMDLTFTAEGPLVGTVVQSGTYAGSDNPPQVHYVVARDVQLDGPGGAQNVMGSYDFTSLYLPDGAWQAGDPLAAGAIEVTGSADLSVAGLGVEYALSSTPSCTVTPQCVPGINLSGGGVDAALAGAHSGSVVSLRWQGCDQVEISLDDEVL